MDIKYKNNKFKKLFIEPLEQRIMLDGAGATTFLDLIDERNQQQVKTNSLNTDIYKEGDKTSDIPFTNVARDKVRNDRKNIVFIDSAVQDYEVIINSFKENTEFYLINATEDGFKKINKTLKGRENIDALHLIGHGSAGEILFGNAFLNNDTITNYQATLASIGRSLTTSGDILFYGCNIAATDQGELLIKKISEITKADIAASDDITGKGGDWDLEKEKGFIDVKKLRVENYDHSLGSLSAVSSPSGTGITHKDANVTIITSGNIGLGNSGGAALTSNTFGIAVEETGVSVSSGDHISDVDVDSNDILNDNDGPHNSGKHATVEGGVAQTASSNITVNSYLFFLVDDVNNRAVADAGEVVFDGEIVGILLDQPHTRHETVDGNIFYSSNFQYGFKNNGGDNDNIDNDGGRVIEGNSTSNSDWQNFFNSYQSSLSSSITDNNGVDWISVSDYGSGTNNRIQFGSRNANTSAGDYIRILVKPTSNNAPVAVANTATVNEDDTITVTGDSATTLTYEANDTVDSQTDVEGDTSENNGTGVSFSSDGRKMFITGIDDNRIHEWTLSNAFDPTSKSYVDSVLLDWNNTDNSGDENYSNDQGTSYSI